MADDVDGTSRDGQSDAGAVRRRTLLKLAVGTGVAVAAHSAPKVSVVPAYGLTTSTGTDGRCYGISWSANAQKWLDTGKDLDPGETGVLEATNFSTSGYNATYTWNGLASGTVGPFNLVVSVSGCANNGSTVLSVSGLPSGYCMVFYNSGRATGDEQDDCGPAASGDLLPSGNYQWASSVVSSGTTLQSSNGGGDCGVNKVGKIFWYFDIKPCP